MRPLARSLLLVAVASPLFGGAARAQTLPPERIHVELRGSLPDVAFHLLERDGTLPAFCEAERWRPECVHRLAAIQPLCIAPCAIDLEAGERLFGVTLGDGELLVLDAPLRLDRDGTVEVTYRSRRPARVVGRVLLGTLLPLAAGCMIATAWSTSTRAKRGFGLGGLGAAALGLGLGFAFAFRADEVSARFVPASPL